MVDGSTGAHVVNAPLTGKAHRKVIGLHCLHANGTVWSPPVKHHEFSPAIARAPSTGNASESAVPVAPLITHTTLIRLQHCDTGRLLFSSDKKYPGGSKQQMVGCIK